MFGPDALKKFEATASLCLSVRFAASFELVSARVVVATTIMLDYMSWHSRLASERVLRTCVCMLTRLRGLQASTATLLTIGMHFRPTFITPAYTDNSLLVPSDLLDYGGYNILFTAELDANNVLRAPLTGELVNLARTFVVNRFQAVRSPSDLPLRGRAVDGTHEL